MLDNINIKIILWKVLMNYEIFWFFAHIQIGPTKTAPLLINPIQMRVLWTEMKYLKSAARLLNRECASKGGLDLSKEVLWVSVSQRVAELQAVKVGGWKKILPRGLVRAKRVRTGPLSRFFSNLQLWQPVDLLPIDLQRPTVPLWKDLNLFCWLRFCPRD